jgi:preprotein translocase SecE subunit
VARSSDQKRRPRVRKNAPTVRERVEATSSKSEASPKRTRRIAAKAGAPLRKVGGSRAGRILKKPFSFLKRIAKWLIPKYFVNSWRELRLVVWPKRRETWRLTLAVFIFAIVFGAMVAGVDKALDEIFKKVILK